MENGLEVDLQADAAYSFNAATTRRPWRTPGPRRTDRPVTRLQCGHDPKAVENAGACDGLSDRCRRLQCGHDPKAVENAVGADACAVSRQTLQCGHDPKAVENAAVAADGIAGLRASMRPRPEGRGERTFSTPNRSCEPALQCGHDPKAVENLRRMDVPPAGGRLQCGHDPKAVENAVLAPVGQPGSVASMRPRPEGRGEPAIAQPIAVARGGLQCGHDPKAVENARLPLDSRWRHVRFNAATTRRPWRTSRSSTARRAADELQCGHDPKAVENAGDRTAACRPAASMRPRPEGRGERERSVTRTPSRASMRPRPEGRGER